MSTYTLRLCSLIFALSPAILTHAEKCSAPPLNLPYRNVSTGPGVLKQGIPIQLGTPWQTIALTPSLQLDGTFIPRFTDTCVRRDAVRTNSTTRRSGFDLGRRDEQPGSFEEIGAQNGSGWEGDNLWVRCGEIYGGGFVDDSSTSFHDAKTNNQNQEPFFRSIDFSSWSFFTELWAFTDYLDVYTRTNDAVPEKRNTTSSFILTSEGTTFGGLGSSALGLSPNSTLVKALFEEKAIPSKSWALTNDSLCFGCVDASSHTGDFQTFKPADRDKDAQLPCLLQAHVEALNWHPNQAVEGVTLIQDSFTACIDPGVDFLVLPTEARDAFKKIVERDVKGEYEDYIAFKGPPKEGVGSLTFRIEGGLTVNITVPGVGGKSAEAGEWKVPIGQGGWGAYGNGTWTLGKPFTDLVVLKWDDAKQEYGIANRNEDQARKEDIQPLGCNDFPRVEKSITTTPGTGILVGSAVGGFVGGILCAVAGLLFYNRGRKGGKSKYEPLGDTVPLRDVPSQQSYMSGPLISPPPSVRESLRSQMSSRAGLIVEPQLAEGNPIHEAPEGGTAIPTKRERPELFSPPLDGRFQR